MVRTRVIGMAMAVAAGSLALALGTTGCASAVDTSDAAAASPVQGQGWRYMTVSIVNQTGHSISTDLSSQFNRQQTTLPNGQATTFAAHTPMAEGTISFPDGSSTSTYAANPFIGPVMAAIHVLPETGAAGYTFDVNQTRTYTYEGHVFSVRRAPDTDSSKQIVFTVKS